MSLYFLRRNGPVKGAERKITPEVSAIYAKTGGRCFYCNSRHAETIDHIIPKHRGGTSEPENLVGACRSCNCSKGSKSYEDFAFELMAEKIAFELSLAAGLEVVI